MKRTLIFALLLLVGSAAGAQVTSDTSFTVYSAFVKAHKKQPFISIVYPSLPRHIIADTGKIYCTFTGRSLHADVFYPPKLRHKTRPGILLIHGGGWRSGSRDQQVPMAQQLAARGYVAITVEYRLSPEAKYPAAVYDLKSAIRWTRLHAVDYGIDKDKIAILGCSAGGQLAALLGTTNGVVTFEGDECNKSEESTVNAIVDIDGILAFTHPESGEGDESKGVSAAAYWLGATRAENPQLWEDASALSHLNKNNPPILFINSGVARMHAGRDDMIRRLDTFDVYHEVHVFADAPHPFWLFEPWFTPTVKYVSDFLGSVFDHE
ncbi:MAG: alpha/beta hydrolase [Flavipsychrobacter sp.]|nr:alpha/beta hydrolase [Flavipsychrobacter sp.]